MPKKSSHKGAGFERSICKTLSLWVSEGERIDALWRSSMSGGRATVMGRSHNKHRIIAGVGDIVATAPEGQLLTELFVMECKAYCDFLEHALVYGHKGRLPDIWSKQVTLGREYERLPMLIFKRDHMRIALGVDARGAILLSRVCEDVLLPTCIVARIGMWVYPFDETLASIPFQRIRDDYEVVSDGRPTLNVKAIRQLSVGVYGLVGRPGYKKVSVRLGNTGRSDGRKRPPRCRAGQ